MRIILLRIPVFLTMLTSQIPEPEPSLHVEHLEITDVSPNQVGLRWDAPVDDDSILRYVIQYKNEEDDTPNAVSSCGRGWRERLEVVTFAVAQVFLLP